MAADKRISKTQLAAELAEATGTSKKTANQFLESLCEIAHREGGRAGEIIIAGLGTIMTVHREPRSDKYLEPQPGLPNSILIYRDPRTGRKRATRTVKDTPLRGKIGRNRIRAAVRDVSRRHNGS